MKNFLLALFYMTWGVLVAANAVGMVKSFVDREALPFFAYSSIVIFNGAWVLSNRYDFIGDDDDDIEAY